MTPPLIGVAGLLLLLLLLLLRTPIGIALALAGFTGNAILQGPLPALSQFQLITWEVAQDFILITLPLFVWMGHLAQGSDLGRDLYLCFHKWFGRIPGGLAATSIVSAASFGTITGSSVATVSTLGQMLLPEMRRYRYDTGLAAGSLASAGVLAILIPPSIPLIFYGAWTETSIGDLFMAGIIPGLLLTVFFSLYVLVLCRLNPALGPAGERYHWREKGRSLLSLLPPISIFAGVLGSIYGGMATPTEAAAIGVACVLLLGVLRRRLTFGKLRTSIEQSAHLSTDIFILLLGGVMFSRFLAQTDLTEMWVHSIATLAPSPGIMVAALVVMYVLLGAALEGFGMLTLTLPFVFPMMINAGFDRVWFGIFLVLMIELSLISPPIGLNVMMLNRLIPDTPAVQIYRGTLPFAVLTLLLVLLLVIFPDLALWLPQRMKL